jgi:hypothetical protein
MDPQIWGAGGWHILHRIAHNHYFNSIHEARRFYESLRIILPCSECRENFKRHLLNNSFPRSLSNLPNWIYRIHLRVDEYLGGKHIENIPTMDSVRSKYKDAAPDMSELVFLRALVRTHPGKRKATSEYLHALHDFIRILFADADMDELSSRRRFATLVRDNTSN